MRLFGKINGIISTADRTYFLMPPFGRTIITAVASIASMQMLTLLTATCLITSLMDADIQITTKIASDRTKALSLMAGSTEALPLIDADRIRSN